MFGTPKFIDAMISCRPDVDECTQTSCAHVDLCTQEIL